MISVDKFTMKIFMFYDKYIIKMNERKEIEEVTRL